MRNLFRLCGVWGLLWIAFFPGYGAGFIQGHFYYVITQSGDSNCVAAAINSTYQPGLVTANFPETVTYKDVEYRVTAIQDYGFSNCPKLKTVNLPKSVIEIGKDAMKYSTLLSRINIEADNPVFSSVDGIVYDKDQSTLLFAPLGVTVVSMPNTVTKIRRNAFYCCEILESVKLSKNLKIIEDYAFHRCSELKEIDIPDGVYYLGKYAFDGCQALKKVKLPESIDSIRDETFFLCKSLERIDIPKNVRVIDSRAFNFCYSLKSLTVPASTEIIEGYALAGCRELANITIDSNNPFLCEVDGMILSKDKQLLISYPAAREVSLPEYIKILGYHAFAHSNLTHIIIPPSVTDIKTSAFFDCRKLKTITCLSTTPPVISNEGRGFLEADSCEPLECIVYVPKEAYKKYKVAPGWKYANILPVKNLSVETGGSASAQGSYTVYSLDGVLRLQTDNRDDIQRLPAGIYIVSGDCTTEKVWVK